MKKTLLLALVLSASTMYGQSYTENFDSNSLEWTECAYESSNGTAIIDKGYMTVESKGEKKALSALVTATTGVNTKIGTNTYFETHCYAPIDVLKSFKITTHVNIGKLAEDRLAGLIFYYRDYGTFYCFIFNHEMVRFNRYVDNKLVGYIEQGVKWKDMKKVDQEWTLINDGGTLSFLVDGLPIMKVKYMPLEYGGVGFYTFGKQRLQIDDITFTQM